MKKYTLDNLREDLTGLNNKEPEWDLDYDKIRNISRVVKSIFCIESITDENKDQYVRVCKLLYKNDDTRFVMNKYSKILVKIREIKVIDGVLTVPKDFKSLENKDSIKVLEVLVEFFKGTELGHFLEERMYSTISEEYNKVLLKFDEEVERIKMSLNGYPCKDKIAKMKEIQEYLNTQRLDIDKNISDNLILPK